MKKFLAIATMILSGFSVPVNSAQAGQQLPRFVFAVLLDTSTTTPAKWSRLKAGVEDAYKSYQSSRYADTFLLFTTRGSGVILKFSSKKSGVEDESFRFRSILQTLRPHPLDYIDIAYSLRYHVYEKLREIISEDRPVIIFILTESITAKQALDISNFAKELETTYYWALLLRSTADKVPKELLAAERQGTLVWCELPIVLKSQTRVKADTQKQTKSAVKRRERINIPTETFPKSHQKPKSKPESCFVSSRSLSLSSKILLILPTILVLLYAWRTTVSLRRRIYIILAPIFFLADDFLLIRLYQGSFSFLFIAHCTLWVGFLLWTRATLRHIWRIRTNRRDATINSDRALQPQIAATTLALSLTSQNPSASGPPQPEVLDPQLLQGCRAVLAGSGRMGTKIIQGLAGTVPLIFDLIDFDIIEEKDTHGIRTIFESHQVGQQKVHAAKDIIQSRFPGSIVNPWPFNILDLPDAQLRTLALKAGLIIAAIDDPKALWKINTICYPLVEVLYVACHRGAASGHLILTVPWISACLRCCLNIKSSNRLHQLRGEPGLALDFDSVATQASRLVVDLLYAKVLGRPVDRFDVTKNVWFITSRRDPNLNPDGPAILLQKGTKQPGCPVCNQPP